MVCHLLVAPCLKPGQYLSWLGRRGLWGGNSGSQWAWAFENRFSYRLGPSWCLHSVGQVLWSLIQRRGNVIGAGAQGPKGSRRTLELGLFLSGAGRPQGEAGLPSVSLRSPASSLEPHLLSRPPPQSPSLHPQGASSPGQGLSLVPRTSSPEPRVICLQET